MRTVGWCLISLACLVPMAAGRRDTPQPATATAAQRAASAVRFEENRGQVGAEVAFLSRAPGYTLFLPARGGGATFRFTSPLGAATPIAMTFAGSSNTPPVAEGALASYSNYFIGRDPARWRTHVPHFARVRYPGVYPGIDLVYHGDRPGGSLEYDLVVHPGADPDRIRMRVDGAARVTTRDGDIEIHHDGGRLVLRAPEVYQEVDGQRRPVSGRFRLAGGQEMQFQLGKWDRTRDLTIDPLVLAYSSYVGGSGNETATDIAVDKQGMVYVAGQTMSTDFPVKGAVQGTLTSAGDAYVLKVNPAATGAASLVYATFLGSSGSDAAEAVAVDDSGRAYVAGLTHAGDFPVTTSGFKPTFTPNPSPNDDESDAFAVILDAGGSSLVYGTFFGGNRDEEAIGIVPRGDSVFYLAGGTDGSTFPTTTSAFDQTGQVRSAFVTVLNWRSNTLRYSTVYHPTGSTQLQVRGLAVDPQGRAHLTGLATGPGLPVQNAFQPTFPTDANGSFGRLGSFLAVIDPAQSGASSLVFATYLGAGDAEDVAVDAQGRSVVIGATTAPGFPVTTGAFQTACQPLVINGVSVPCQRDAFVMRIDPGQSGAASLVAATRLGGARSEAGQAVTVDSDDNVLVTGSTSSGSFPLVNPLSGMAARADGEVDAFVARFSPQLDQVTWSTRIGGVVHPSGNSVASDVGTAIAVASDGSVCIAGHTSATDFPITGGFDASLADRNDAFVVKLTNVPAPCVEVNVAVLDGRDFEWEPPPEICIDWPGGFPGGGLPGRCPPPECPKCGLPGMDGQGMAGMPEYLVRAYSEGAAVLGAGGLLKASTKRPLPAARSFLSALERAPEGTYFTRAVHQRVQRVLGTTRGTFIGLAQQRRAATEALNAMELDRRLGRRTSAGTQAAEGQSVRFDGLGSVRLTRGKGAVGVEVQAGLPAWPGGNKVQTGWPLATFSVVGPQGATAEVELDVSWINFGENAGGVRLLSWNGKRYRNTKATYDPLRGTVKGLVPIGERLVVVRLIPCRQSRPFMLSP